MTLAVSAMNGNFVGSNTEAYLDLRWQYNLLHLMYILHMRTEGRVP